MKKIKLLNGKFTLVDDCDFDNLNKYRWYFNRYVIRFLYNSKGRPVSTIAMHREITGVAKGRQIDHKDGNKLNNQRENLRECSHAENQRNRGKYKNNTTGYKGVNFRKDINKFRARIKVNNKIIEVGRFKTAKEAAIAYNKAAIKYHGEFAYLNKVE